MYKSSPYVWGAFLIGLGALLLAERFGHLHLPAGSFWPFLVFFVGVGQLVRHRYIAAAWYLCLALVFLACTLGLYGLTYAKSWPLLLVLVGVSMVIRAFTGGGSCYGFRKELDHE